MMVAMQYEAMRRTFGDDKFNEMFPSNKRGLYVGPVGDPETEIYPRYGSSETNGKEKHPFTQLGLYAKTEYAFGSFNDAKVKSELVIGDWVYFKNHPDYERCRPFGFWSGEHAMYVGDGKFMGFGLGAARTYQEILDALQLKYEEECGKKKDPGLTSANQPGIVARLVPNTRKLDHLPKVTK